MQSADHRGVVMMHAMPVCEYGHWLINNASVTNMVCMLLFVKDSKRTSQQLWQQILAFRSSPKQMIVYNAV